MSWKAIRSGKVNELFANAEKRLIALVASDRMPGRPRTCIPEKGANMTALTNYWAIVTAAIPNAYIWDLDIIEEFCAETVTDKGRVTIQRLATPLPVEVIIRGFVTDDLWRTYERGSRSISGITLPEELTQSEHFQNPLFTPVVKDQENQSITFANMTIILKESGYRSEVAEYIRRASIRLYNELYYAARQKGFIYAETGIKFGIDEATRQIYIIGEIGTPNNSRIWRLGNYRSGEPQKEYEDYRRLQKILLGG